MVLSGHVRGGAAQRASRFRAVECWPDRVTYITYLLCSILATFDPSKRVDGRDKPGHEDRRAGPDNPLRDGPARR